MKANSGREGRSISLHMLRAERWFRTGSGESIEQRTVVLSPVDFGLVTCFPGLEVPSRVKTLWKPNQHGKATGKSISAFTAIFEQCLLKMFRANYIGEF